MSNPMRYEIKMVLDGLQLGEVRSWVYGHSDAFRTAFPPRQVNNIYFDSLTLQFMRDHIDGVPARAKVRYRWYGETWWLGGGQLELKKKIGRLGYKQTFPFSGELDLSRHHWGEVLEQLRAGIEIDLPEIAATFDLLQPTLVNQYQREYYLSIDGAVRLTLDYDLRAFEQGFGFKPNLRHCQPLRDAVVVELKAAKREHRKIADALSEFPQRVSQNSKYLSGMETSSW